MFLFQLVYLIFLVFGVFYIPGRFLLSILGYKLDDFIIHLFSSFAVGVSSFLIFTYLLSWFKLGFIYNLFILPIIFFEGIKLIRKVKYEEEKYEKKYYIMEFLLIIFGSLAMYLLTASSGLLSKEGLLFFSSNKLDGIFHLALIGNLVNNFPPTHPELANIPLRGYHFFYDFLIANFAKFYKLDLLDLTFRYAPFLIAFFYGLGNFALGRFLKLKKFSIIILLFLVYFGAGFEFIWKLHSPNLNFNPGVNALILNIINPSVLLGMAILFAFYILTFGKNRPKNVLIPALLLGILPQMKIYIALIGFGSLAVLALFNLVKNKNTYYLKILFEAGFVASIIYLPFNLHSSGLIFAPLLLYRHFMEQLSTIWAQRIQIFETHSNILQIAILYFQAIVLFFIPTLGLRILSFFGYKSLISKKFYSENNLFWVCFVVFGLIFASFFIQASDVFNIVQFLWPIYIILLIPTAIVIGNLANNNRIFKFALFIFVAAVSFIPNLQIFKAYSQDKYVVSKDVLQMSQYIKNNLSQNDNILVVSGNGGPDYYYVPLFAALSQHQIFYEPTITEFKESEKEKDKRTKIVSRIESLLSGCTGDVGKEIRQLMQESGNQFLLTTTKYDCIDNISYFKKISQHGNESLYRL